MKSWITPDDEAFYRRVQYFAKAAVVAAIVVACMGLVRMLLSYMFVASSSRSGWLPEILREVTSTGIVAMGLLGLAVISLLAARLVAAETRPRWAPRLDETFVRRANMLAIGAMGLAGFYLLVAPIFNLGHLITGAGGPSGFSNLPFVLTYVASTVTAILAQAGKLLLGGLVIQALLRISRREEREPEVRPWENSSDF